MEWMLLPLKRYADFSGRSRRKEFWMFTLGYVIILAVLAIGLFSGASLSTLEDPAALENMAGGGTFIVFAILMGIVVLALLIPSIAVNVRRLHDRDMSGWWYLGFAVLSNVPYVGILVSIGYLVLMALPGTEGPNRFGPDPKNPHSAEVFE
ncbi:DUF805 domain-containing protein [Altererythrobacter indicus]|uniref:DUF805 domain-containing protein n=1 Tax=Altericroceibacterium indicum TaxID=374177 RepID=A0A845A5Z6_9SPHN|nr:DUF805 domain-containing protein [Altericroceibacterium indicum]MXP25620.1 DUF805 domain-containing protein [Altericroceibacterium indicum]